MFIFILSSVFQAGSLFYRRVESSPCLQQAFKYGIMSGFGGGLLGFLFTCKYGVSSADNLCKQFGPRSECWS